MGLPEWKVTEIYPYGGEWSHYFYTEREAREAIEDLHRAHPGRSYELEQLRLG